MSIAAEGGLYVFRPFLLPLWVFLSPNSIDVMWEQSGCLIRGVAQTTARSPGLQSTWRGRSTCKQQIESQRWNKNGLHRCLCWQVAGGRSLPMFHVPTNTEITSGSLCFECFDFISWRRWQKASRFWKMETIPWGAWKGENDSIWGSSFLTRALSKVISRGVLWWLSMTMLILLWSLTIWRTEAQQMSAGNTFAWDMNRKVLCLTPLMRDPLHPKRHSLSVEKQHARVYIHRDRLSAIPQHLHLDRWKKK